MVDREQVIAKLQAIKQASFNLAPLDEEKRNSVLQKVADGLRINKSIILMENRKDIEALPTDAPMVDRLLLTNERIERLACDVERVIKLPSPLHRIFDQKKLPSGLEIHKISVPFGVIAVIYESRPNVTVDVFSLCFKTGNCSILKGGKEADHSNRILVKIIHQALQSEGLTEDFLYLVPLKREFLSLILHANGLIDLCIPRGGHSLIHFVRDHATIPTIETGAGIVHTYFDESGDLLKGRSIIHNAKTRRVTVCNALDCLIIHRSRLNDLDRLVEPLAATNVELFADEPSYGALSLYPKKLLHRATEEDFGKEFLSYKLAIKTVSTIDEAIGHIMSHTSGHSEALVAEDPTKIAYFLKRVDAAAVYANAPTSFTDGGEFGMGAEIGISTQKLHARGPMGLEALTSYKWVIHGDGQIRT